MKGLFSILMILAAIIPGINDIATINKLKREAREAFLAGNYAKAAETYTILSDSMGVMEDKVLLNLGHALFQNGDSAQAFTRYQQLIESKDASLKSIALNQMGILSSKPGQTASAASFFKAALKADPTNSEARYNYQVMKRKQEEENESKEEQEKSQEDQQNQPLEPSEFAKKLKEEADRLVSQRRYAEALELMSNGLKKDETVAFYEKYILRLKDVSIIY